MSEVSHDDIEVKVTAFERLLGRLCLYLVPLVPRSATPNQITVLGGVCGVAGGAFFLLGAADRSWLAAAAAAILLHLILDTLDGCVARERNQKSDLGYFLDQFLDLVAFTAIVLGIGLSPYARFDIAVLAAVLYPINLAVTLHWINLRRKWVFPLMGPSEVLAILVMLTVATYFVPGPIWTVAGFPLTVIETGFILGLLVGSVEIVKMSIQLMAELSGGKK